MNKKIQVLRGLAIIAVVFCHVTARGDLTQIVVRNIVNYGVATFIFCSGYLTGEKIQDLWSFYKKRLSRVLVPYVLWTLVYHYHYSRPLRMLPRELATGMGCDIYYFILVYIQLVILTPVLIRMLKSRFSFLVWSVSPVYLVVIRYLLPAFGYKPQWPFPETIFCGWLSYYCIGLALRNGYLKWEKSLRSTAVMYLAALLLVQAEGSYWLFHRGDWGMALTQLKLGALLAQSAVLLLEYCYLRDDFIPCPDRGISKALILCGNCSFGIYLLHPLIIDLLEGLEIYSWLQFPFTTIAVFLVSMVLIMIGAKVFGRISRYLGFA